MEKVFLEEIVDLVQKRRGFSCHSSILVIVVVLKPSTLVQVIDPIEAGVFERLRYGLDHGGIVDLVPRLPVVFERRCLSAVRCRLSSTPHTSSQGLGGSFLGALES